MQAVSRARPAFEIGLDICAFLFLPVLVLASRGAAPLVAVAGLCALGLNAANFAAAWRRVRGLALPLALLVLWGLVSSLWAIAPQRSLLIALRLAGMCAAGLALIAAASELAAAQRLLTCLLAGFFAALALVAAQFWTGGGLTARFTARAFIEPSLNHAEDGLGFLLMPLCAVLILRQRCVLAAFLAALGFAAICQLVGDAARLAFIVGTGAALLLYWRRMWVVRAAAVASIALILATPLVFPPLGGIPVIHRAAHHVKSSLWHRLEIWAFVGSRIAEKPLGGWGLDSSRAIPGGDAPIPEGYPGQVSLPLHPHNAALQIWLELGVPGALLFAMLIAALWLALGSVTWPPLYAAATGGSLVTALIVALGSYGIWQEWLVCSEFLTLFLILVMARIAAQPMPETRSGSIS